MVAETVDGRELRKGYRLHPKQLEAAQLLGLVPGGDGGPPIEQILYGGQSGGGKSHLARAVGVAICSKYPGIRVPLFRRKYPELEDSHIAWIRGEIGPPVATYHQGQRELRFANGSVLMFRHCENEQDVYDYLTAEWGGLIIDQAEQFTSFMLKFLRHRVRVSREKFPDWSPVIFLSANPGGLSHEYLRTHFVDVRVNETLHQVTGEEEGRPIEPETVFFGAKDEGELRSFYLPARLVDNPSLDREQYLRMLIGLPEHLRKAYASGDWHLVPGAFFEEWMPQTVRGEPWHVWSEAYARQRYGVPEDQPFPPKGWARWTGTDGGFNDPWCTLWAARAPDKRTVVYRERYGSKIGIPEQARLILRAEREEGVRVLDHKADPAMFTRRANLTVSDAEVYAQCGLLLSRGTNAREPGWRRLREALTTKLDDQLPSLVFLEGRTPHLLRTLPTLMAHKTHKEDLEDDQEDHAADCLRYLIMPAMAPTYSRRGRSIRTAARTQKPDPRLGITGIRSAWG